MATATSLSAYLIPISSNKNSKLNLISNYDSKDTKNFSETERDKLEKLTKSFEKLLKALKNSTELRELINSKMEELLSFVSKSENVLAELYKEHLKIIEKLFKTFEERFEHNLKKMDNQSKLKNAEYRRELLKKLNSGVGEMKKPFESFVEEITKYEEKNQKSSQGGALR